MKKQCNHYVISVKENISFHSCYLQMTSIQIDKNLFTQKGTEPETQRTHVRHDKESWETMKLLSFDG